MMSFSLILSIAAAFIVVAIIARGVLVVKQSECVVIERLGSFHATLENGLNFVIPFIDQARTFYWSSQGIVLPVNRIDLRETVLDVPEQSVITRDNVSIKLDAILYIQITNPVRAIYEIENLPVAVAQLAQTSLRNVIGEMDLDQSLISRDTINAKLKIILDEACEKWGTKVNRVELKNITPPREIQQAMEKQMQAERERRARVLEAEGDKQSRIARSEGLQIEQINISEGDKQAQLLRAQGEAAATITLAQAKRKAIEELTAALGGAELASKYLVAVQYLETFAQFSQKAGDKVFLPYEATTSLAGVGLIAELIKGKKE